MPALRQQVRGVGDGLDAGSAGCETEELHEQVKTRARYIIEEGRLNYDQAVQEMRRLNDEERNDRLEGIARSSMRATWFALVVAGVSLLVSLFALLKGH